MFPTIVYIIYSVSLYSVFGGGTAVRWLCDEGLLTVIVTQHEDAASSLLVAFTGF